MKRLRPSGLILAVALIIGLLGPIDTAPQAAGIALGLGVWAAGARSWSWLLVLAGVPLLLHMESVEARLAILTGMGLIMAGPAGGIAARFGAAVLGWRLLLQGIPWIWRVEVELSRLVSGGIGSITGQSIDFGPTASGLDLFMLFLLYAAAARGSGAAISLKRIGWAAVALGLFMALLPALGRAPAGIPFDFMGLFNQANEHLAVTPQEQARLMFGWLAPLLAVLCLALPVAEAPGRIVTGRARSWELSTVAALSMLLMALCIVAGGRSGERRPGEVVLLGSPSIDMEVPVAGRYGSGRAGMFGMLPRYLALDGHQVRRHEGALTEESLSRATVVIAVLPAAPYTPEERRILDAFVQDGGSLLVLGDHTDLLGSMGPLNELTGPWGIRLRFDSAFPAVREWSGCLDGEIQEGGSRTGIGTGSSLQIRGKASPLVIGRYALADAGDRSNGGQGGYLGNYAYDDGEQLGDLVLAARVNHGRGSVVVFGDTSPFQNLMLPSSYSFIASLLDDLARPATRSSRLAASGAGVPAAALGALAVVGSPAAAGALAAVVLATTLWTGFAAGPAPLDRLADPAPVALVDAGHLNAYAREMWHGESIGGLIVNLERAGYLPLFVEDGYARRRLGPPTLPVLQAPRRSLTTAEALSLAAHIGRGGDVLVAAGGDEAGFAAPLLTLFGLSIGTLPLGPVPILPDMDRAAWEAQRKQPQFRRAWPISSAGVVAVRSRYRAFDFDVVVEARARQGPGRLIVIADPDFLTDRVLESENGAWEGNVDFLAQLLARKQGA